MPRRENGNRFRWPRPAHTGALSGGFQREPPGSENAGPKSETAARQGVSGGSKGLERRISERTTMLPRLLHLTLWLATLGLILALAYALEKWSTR